MGKKKLGTIISYANLIVQSLSTILLTPFFIRRLGQSEYGLFELVGSAVSYLSVIGFGFSSSYIRFYSRYKAKNDEKSIAYLNGLFMSLFILMSLICISVGLILTYNIRFVFGTGIPDNDYVKAQIIMIILVVNMALTFPRSLFVCNTSAHEEFVFQKVLLLFEAVTVPILRIFFVIKGSNSIGLAMASLIVSIISMLVDIFYNVNSLKIKIGFKEIDFSLFKEITVFTSFIFLNKLFDLMGGRNVDIFIIGRIINTSEVTVYSVADKFVKIFFLIASPIVSVFVPQINQYVNKPNSILNISRLFNKVSKVQIVIQLMFLEGFIVLGEPFIKCWVGDGYERSFYIALIIMCADVVALSQSIGVEIQMALNKHQARSIVYFLINIGNILLSIPLTRRMGAIGAAIATACMQFLGTVLFMNYYYAKVIGIEIKTFWGNFFKVLLSTIPVSLLVLLIRHVISANSLLHVIILAIIYSFLYAFVVVFFVFSREERKNLLRKGV